MSSIYCNATVYTYIYTSRVSLSKLSSIHSVVGLGSIDCNATVYATQLLNSLKCFPDPLCMHGVVNLSSTDSVVTLYAAQSLNSLKGFAPPWLSSIEGDNQEQHRGWHRVVTLYAAQPLNSLKGFAPPLVEQHTGSQSRAA